MMPLENKSTADADLQSFPTMTDAFWDLAPSIVWVATRSSDHTVEMPRDGSWTTLRTRFLHWRRTNVLVVPDEGEAWRLLAEQIALGKVKASALSGHLWIFGQRRFLDESVMGAILDFAPSDVPEQRSLKLTHRGQLQQLEHVDVLVSREDLVAAFPRSSVATPVPEVRSATVKKVSLIKPTRRGPPLTYSRQAVEAAKAKVMHTLLERGEPDKHDEDPDWQTQKALENLIADTMAEWQQYPKPTWLKTKRAQWLAEWVENNRDVVSNN